MSTWVVRVRSCSADLQVSRLGADLNVEAKRSRELRLTTLVSIL